MIKLYTDGGVVVKNPSPYAGTWAYVKFIPDHLKPKHKSGYLTRDDMGVTCVTNNHMELYAILRSLKSLASTDVARIYSDSQITLGRVFCEHSMNNVPEWMLDELSQQKERLVNWSQFEYRLVAGHPTRKELRTGLGRNGNPVSKWNKYCDDLCRNQAKQYWREHEES